MAQRHCIVPAPGTPSVLVTLQQFDGSGLQPLEISREGEVSVAYNHQDQDSHQVTIPRVDMLFPSAFCQKYKLWG